MWKWTYLLFIIIAPSVFGDGAIIRFIERDSYHGNQDIYINDLYSGNIGDYIDLAEGIYEVSYKSKYGYTISFTLRINGAAVVVSNFGGVRRGLCDNDFDPRYELSDWWHDVLVDIESPVASVLLPTPNFVSSTKNHSCVHAMFGIAAKKAATLHIMSNPEGAEIYSPDADYVGQTNHETLMYFNPRRTAVRIVLKLDGYANCIRDIRTKDRGDFRESVHCDMTQLPSGL